MPTDAALLRSTPLERTAPPKESRNRLGCSVDNRTIGPPELLRPPHLVLGLRSCLTPLDVPKRLCYDPRSGRPGWSPSPPTEGGDHGHSAPENLGPCLPLEPRGRTWRLHTIGIHS